MSEPREYSDRALTQIKEGKTDAASTTLNQAFMELNPTKFKDVIDKMVKANPQIEVEERDTYGTVKDFPKTVTLHGGGLFGSDKQLFRKK